MAFDTYVMFKDPDGNFLQGESQVNIIAGTESTIGKDLGGMAGKLFEIDDFNFGIEQVLNISSQSSGAGAGKVTFNEFTITRKIDRATPTFFTMCCAGQHFEEVWIFLRRAGGGGSTLTNAGGSGNVASGTTFLRYDFKLVAIKTISHSGSDGDDAMKEEIAFEYGAVRIRYVQQDSAGKPMTTSAGNPMGQWSKVLNNNSYGVTTS